MEVLRRMLHATMLFATLLHQCCSQALRVAKTICVVGSGHPKHLVRDDCILISPLLTRGNTYFSKVIGIDTRLLVSELLFYTRRAVLRMIR